MTNVWCVRAEYGKYTKPFVDGGYVAIGWMYGIDLSAVKSRDELYPLYKKAHPGDKSNVVIGQQVGQIARFLLEIQPGDYVITPAADTEWLYYGKVAGEPSYIYAAGDDGCAFRHRRRIEWAENRLRRGDLSVPFQRTMASSLTVFSVSQRDEFFGAIGRADMVAASETAKHDAYGVVLEQIMRLDPREFEVLVTHLLTAIGFEGSQAVGKSGDGGVDATGELNVANMARVRLFVQAKRYRPETAIAAKVVKQLRQSIPSNGQGAFVTTADYQSGAADIAVEPGFPRIGLINGRQLVDLLVEHWNDIPEEFRERLGLKPGLVRA